MKKIPKIWLWTAIGLLATSASCEKKVAPEVISEVTTTIDFGKSQTVNVGGNSYQIKLIDFEDKRVPNCDTYFGAPIPAKMTFEINNSITKYELLTCYLNQELLWDEKLYKLNFGKISNSVSFQVLSLKGTPNDKSSYKSKIILKTN